MLKVFLVEDEIVMREGIKKNINWEREGFSFVGEASDGELAYPLIQKTRPDILITDIKMPFMDGLELSRLVKQELPDIKILILSGYDEFDYAKEAISIGVTDYLVKPISGAKLLEAVKRVAEVVEEEKRQKQYLETFLLEQQENTQLAEQKLFRSLVSAQKPVSVLLVEAREIGMELAANRYNIMRFQIFCGENTVGYSEEENQAIEDIRELVEEMQEILLIELGIEGCAFILKETDGRSLEDLEQDFMERLREIFKNYPGLAYFGGVGLPVGRLGELGKSFEKASRAFSYRYLRERNQFIESRREESVQPPAVDELDLSSLTRERMNKKAVRSFLRTGLTGEVSHFVEEYFESLGQESIQSLLFRQYMTMDLYLEAAGVLEETGVKPGELSERCGDFQKSPQVVQSSEQMKAYVKKLFLAAVELRDSVSKRKYSSLLQEARTFIEQHYEDEDISLNTVAANVNLSPNHFSSIFSQETGQTFIEFLTQVRMERAKELLRSTSMKTAEIAFAVGYKDPHYFSYLFKKTQECTPREFRLGR